MEKELTRIMGYSYTQKEHMLNCVSTSCTTMKDLQADPGVDTNKGFLNNQNKQRTFRLT